MPAASADSVELAVLELFPHTGRAHQLRRHMASIGHPLVGDARYNPRVAAALEASLISDAGGHIRDGQKGSGRGAPVQA